MIDQEQEGISVNYAKVQNRKKKKVLQGVESTDKIPMETLYWGSSNFMHLALRHRGVGWVILAHVD